MITMIKSVAMRAATSSAVRSPAPGESFEERLALIVRWCTVRYYRVD